jgi:hypothetical protein
MEIINRMNRETDKKTYDNRDDAVNETKKDPNYKDYFIKISPSKITHSIIIIKPPSKEEGKKRKVNLIKQGQVGDVVH